jgi:hypothetical protein
MIVRALLGSLALAAILVSSGCACELVGSYAVNVQVLDAATGAPAVEGATLVIRDRDYEASAVGGPGGPPVLAAGFEREGSYEVRVTRPGYREWVRENVRVGRGGFCNELRSVALTARLEPAQSAP